MMTFVREFSFSLIVSADRKITSAFTQRNGNTYYGGTFGNSYAIRAVSRIPHRLDELLGFMGRLM